MDNTSTSSRSSSGNFSEEGFRKAGKRVPKRRSSYDYEDITSVKVHKSKDLQSSRDRTTRYSKSMDSGILKKNNIRNNVRSNMRNTIRSNMRNNVRKSRKKQRARNKVRGTLQEDNSTNSDNSDKSDNALFSEINWEENLEVDTSSLLDEFAPRPPKISPKSESQDSVKVPEVEVKEVVPVAEAKLENPSPEPGNVEYEFTPGSQIHVMDYTTTTWLQGTVAEVDWDEEEVLVHYDGNKSDEWVSMNSQRLSRNKPVSSKPVPAKPPVESNEATVAPTPKIPTPKVAVAVSKTETRSISHNTDEPKLRTREHRSLQRRNRRNARKDIIQKRRGSKAQDKFTVGEKVLAKWSDHRMQKFPAVIKKVLGQGQYDVLFYDGFEKTLMADDLFKASEEEVERYQNSNPSEADLLFAMDICSKEERRQRKKKTFDDFLFEKDFYKSRKKSEMHSEVDKPSSSNVRKHSLNRRIDKPALLDVRKSIKKSRLMKPLQTTDLHKKKMKRKEKQSDLQLEHVDDKLSDEGPEQPPEKVPQFDNKSVEKRNEPLPLLDYSSEHTLSAETFISMEENSFEGNISKRIPASQLSSENDRWIDDIPSDVHPVKVTGLDGVQRKSVIVPDKKLPDGWTKHAVLVQAGGDWECFLISSDGYKLNCMEDVKEYFLENNQDEPPDNLDFTVYMRALPELVLKQNELIATGTFKKWERKRGKRSRKASFAESPAPVPQVPHQVGRVRTLLPKYRTASPVNIPQPSSPAPANTVVEGEHWKCPKQGCDKKFRKENLLQMHIKHYHVEFKALVGSAPNVVDLALARSENANSDWRQEQAKTGLIKRIMPKMSPYPEKQYDKTDTDRLTVATQGAAASQPPPVLPQTSSLSRNDVPGCSDDSLTSKRPPSQPVDERKTTIKTILPIRPSVPDTPLKLSRDSEEAESDDNFSTDLVLGDSQKLQPTNKLYKQSRSKKARAESNRAPSLGGPVEEFGMRDHGYQVNPGYKFIKKKQLLPIDKLQVGTDSNDSYTEEEKISPNMEVVDEIVNVDRIRSEEVINCTCGYKEEDGLMIQCDICLCWQHGLCYGIENESDVPDRYVCIICQHPVRVRSSKRYSYAELYLTQAKLPSLSFRTCKDAEIKQREGILKRSFDIASSLNEIKNVEHSLRAKINIAQQANHPKLYLWAKNWDEMSGVVDEKDSKEVKNDIKTETDDADHKTEPAEMKPRIPVPEPPINSDECRLRLIEHIERYQQQVESRLSTIQAQVAALESEDPDLACEESNDHYPFTKQTVHMLLRDLGTIKKVASLS